MSKTIYRTALLLPLALGGCFATSVKGMREREPVLVADSIYDANTIIACVSEAWQGHGSTPKSLPRTKGATVIVEQPGAFYALPIMVVDADTTSTGSHVTMRQFKAISGKVNRKRVEEVRACL